jgi:hypothetical protein
MSGLSAAVVGPGYDHVVAVTGPNPVVPCAVSLSSRWRVLHIELADSGRG